LKPQKPLRLELTGFQYCYQDLTIESIGDEVVGPAEVRRFLGQELADTVPLSGPVVLVQASLPSRTLVCEGRTFNYFNGMVATADARGRCESFLGAFIPGGREVLGSSDD